MMKVCKDCNEAKQLCEFVKDNRTHDGRTNQCKKCTNVRRKQLYKENPEKVNQFSRNYYLNNSEKVLKRLAKYRENNKEKRKQCVKNWKLKNPKAHAIISKRCKAKHRRDLGYKPINKKEIGNVGHHIDKNLVIYIPEELHKLVYHSQGDLISMKEINTLAIQVAYV